MLMKIWVIWLKILTYQNLFYKFLSLIIIAPSPPSAKSALEIDNISKDILEGKTQSSFPGIKKKNILLNSKIITNWINA